MTLTYFKDFSRRPLKLKTFSRLYEPRKTSEFAWVDGALAS